jgi:cytochrome P450
MQTRFCADFQLAPGLIVPAGAIMAAPVHLLHLNPVCWGNDSADFNPERFLKPKSEFCLNVKANSSHIHNELNQTQKDANMSEKRVFQPPPLDSGFLLFGTGARSCIGANFALTEILSLVAALVQGYEVLWQLPHLSDIIFCRIAEQTLYKL